jgi:hypothetical protein
MNQRNLTMAAIIAVVLAVMVVGYIPQIQAEDYKSDRQSYSTICIDDKPCQTTICIDNQPCRVIKSSPASSIEDTENTKDR